MENLRTKLAAAALTVLITAGVIFGMTFIRAGDPHRKNLPRIDVAKLAPGRFAVQDVESFRYFIIYPQLGDLFVLAAPLVDGAVPMPDEYWWRPIIRCKSFGMEPNDGIVRVTSRLRCRDAQQPEEWAARWQWDVHGRHVPDAANTPVADLYRVRIERSGHEIILLALESE